MSKKKNEGLDIPSTKNDILNLENRVSNVENVVSSMEYTLSHFRNEVLNRFDRVFKEFEKAKEDRVFAIGKDREQDQKIEHIDKRVKILEESRA